MQPTWTSSVVSPLRTGALASGFTADGEERGLGLKRTRAVPASVSPARGWHSQRHGSVLPWVLMSKRGCPVLGLPWGRLTPSGRFLQPHGLQGRPCLKFLTANMRELRASWPRATQWMQGSSWPCGDSGFRPPQPKDNDGFRGQLWGPEGHGITAADRMEVRPAFPATIPQGNWLLLGKTHRHCPWSLKTQMPKQSQE